jgi:hypothetical protein
MVVAFLVVATIDTRTRGLELSSAGPCLVETVAAVCYSEALSSGSQL